ncbi:TPA: N-6 DNA methylase [Enterococcus faecium]
MAVKKSELYSLLWEACNKLRGGVEPARYKDYVLILLFFKYVSDRYKGVAFGDFTVKPGASFDDLIEAKGKPDIGERVDKILQSFLETNQLQGSLPDVSFNNEDELGKGKELVDKVTGLISIFQNPAIDFKTNRASGDDIIGDAYEYFMMKFAQESGKSKGQFYTPSEVSRIMARLIRIGEIVNTPDKKWTLYDPACGSGSLLIRAADEAPTDDSGDSIVTIYGQEKDHSTAGLAQMNLILHQKGTGEIKRGNTLSDPQLIDGYGQLKRFDFVVMNPPFSDKSWSDGVDSNDRFNRFAGFGMPPAKNGDYAWFLHVLASLNDKGKAAIILPHGILFRGNSEETIRKQIIDRKYIVGIVSLPANLFYGTGIPACIVVIDKENADKHEGIFMIDASRDYMKDGNKNRLREQDIERIIRTFNNKEEIKGYSRMVTYEEIMEKNDGNLNVPRYIQPIDNGLTHNVEAHLLGGIPNTDIESLSTLWEISPELKKILFKEINGRPNFKALCCRLSEIEEIINNDTNIVAEIRKEKEELFQQWKDKVEKCFKEINPATNPKLMIREISDCLLQAYSDAVIVDQYDVYDVLLNYWNEKLQDDIYVILNLGYVAAREIEYIYKQKKEKKNGVEQMVDDKTKVKSFDGVLIPKTIITDLYFANEQEEINSLELKAEALIQEIEELAEEHCVEEGLLEVFTEEGFNLNKTNVNKRIKDIKNKEAYDEEFRLLTQIKILYDDQKKIQDELKEK